MGEDVEDAELFGGSAVDAEEDEDDVVGLGCLRARMQSVLSLVFAPEEHELSKILPLEVWRARGSITCADIEGVGSSEPLALAMFDTIDGVEIGSAGFCCFEGSDEP